MEPAERTERDRPAAIPESGFWNESLGKWEVPELGADGAKHGDCLLYRSDGSLYSRTRFVAGVEDGPFAIYHPDGRVAREGRFIGGRLDGLVTSYAAGDRSGEPLRACCVPPNAARLDIRYREGDYLLEVFYDREGQAILSDGRPSPPRPAELPELAGFNETRGGWTLSSGGVDRFWTAEGALVEEIENPPGGGRVVRLFDGQGGIREQHGFDKDDKRTGPFLRRFAPDVAAPFADPRAREERGGFERGQAVGLWTYLDASGAVVRTLERGPAATAALVETSPAFADRLADGWGLARALDGEGRVREALCAAARAAAADRDLARLLGFLDARRFPPPPDAQAEWGEALARAGDADLPRVLDGLVLGTDPAAVFRALAAVLPATSAAAAEFVEASLLLAPERRMTHLTRALIRVQRGDVEGARADAAVVAEESPDSAASLLTYLRVTFRPFEPAAAREPLAPNPEPDDVPPAVVQDLDAIRHMVGVYATRIGRLRVAILALLDGAADAIWLPPDLSALLPDGPVPLRRERIVCTPEAGGGGGDGDGGGGGGDASSSSGGSPAEPETVDIDEELTTDGLGVPMLLGLAQADYGALAWLCWSVGLDRVALPEAIAPADALAAAMTQIVKRYWRVHDRLTTGGLLALSHGVPGFAWQGLDLDVVPAHLVSAIAAEYLAARSMFIWLASPDTMSPFQDDIRDA